MPSVMRSYVRAMDRISDWIGFVAIYIIYVMVAVLLFDVVTNRIIGPVATWLLSSGNGVGAAVGQMLAGAGLDGWADRNINLTQNWTTEFAQFTLAAYYFLAGPKTLKDEDHVRLDLLYSRLTDRGRARMDAVTIWLVIFYLVILFWGGLSSLQYSIETNQRLPSLWAPSIVPIKVVMVICLGLMILQSLAIFFRDLGKMREGAPA